MGVVPTREGRLFNLCSCSEASTIADTSRVGERGRVKKHVVYAGTPSGAFGNY